MARTKAQLDKLRDKGISPSHASWCHYPSDPCSCEVYCKHERRTYHETWCDYPSGPCDCGLHEHPA